MSVLSAGYCVTVMCPKCYASQSIFLWHVEDVLKPWTENEKHTESECICGNDNTHKCTCCGAEFLVEIKYIIRVTHLPGEKL
jgi:hypothetical protein